MPASAATTSIPGRPRAPANGGAALRDCSTIRRQLLADYVGLVQSLGLYPGSPAIARALLRPDDRLVCCELHPEDAAIAAPPFRREIARSRCIIATRGRRLARCCRRSNGAASC